MVRQCLLQPTAMAAACWRGCSCSTGSQLSWHRCSASSLRVGPGALWQLRRRGCTLPKVCCVKLGVPWHGVLFVAASPCSYSCRWLGHPSPASSEACCCPCREGGWAGVVFNPARPAVTALARGFARDIQLFDAGVHVRSFGMHLHPYALRFLPIAHGAASDLLAVAEAHTVGGWCGRWCTVSAWAVDHQQQKQSRANSAGCFAPYRCAAADSKTWQ